ncbi:MAG: hypothetical protein ABI759_13830 [Candidatus Solibacter sp.]
MANLHPRRYVFHGHASGVSVHIRRPERRLFPTKGCSALTVTGGLAEDEHPAGRFERWVSYEGVTTRAHGDYVDADKGEATTRGEIAFDAVPVETTVTAEVRGLNVLDHLRIARLRLNLISRSAKAGEQPVIRIEGNVLDGVQIDDSRLKITLAEGFFQECDTKDKLAKRHAAGLASRQGGIFLPLNEGGDALRVLPEAKGVVKCTIVQEMAWDGPAHPTATLHGHVVHLPDFGRIYFGELFIAGESRRLTMVRCQLGSPDGGEVAVGDGETNGSNWPPT